ELSRAQLAEKLDITEQAVWQYENGYVSPKIEVINKMKSLFKVKSAYFYREDLLANQPENIRMERIAYRSETMNLAIKTQSELMHVRFFDAFMKRIGKRIKYPKNELVSLRNRAIEYLNENQKLDRKMQIRHI